MVIQCPATIPPCSRPYRSPCQKSATEAYEAALASVCASVGFFRDHATGDWRIEGVKEVATGDSALAAALALAESADRRRRHARTPQDPGGGLARAHPGELPGTAYRPPVRRARHPSGRAADAGTHHADAGCRAWPSAPASMARPAAACARWNAWRTGIRAASWTWAPVRGFWRWGRRGCCGAACWRPTSSRGRCASRSRMCGSTGYRIWSRRGWRMAGGTRRCAATVPTTWCSPTSWRGRSARWRATSRPISRRAGRRYCPDCWTTQARWVLAAHRRRGLRLERRLAEGVWATLVLRR